MNRSRPSIRLPVSLIILIAVALSSCTGRGGADEQAPVELYRFSRFAMDTVVEYSIFAPSREAALEAMIEAHTEIERISALLWEEDAESTVNALNAGAELESAPAEVQEFIERIGRYVRDSDGRFDPTVKAALDLYEFKSENPVPPDDSALASARARIGFDRFVSDPDVRVAVGGVAKGYAVDRAVAVLRGIGIRDALVNAGGDLYALGTRSGEPWIVGVRHPDAPDRLVDTLRVTDAAVATSGDYQQYFVVQGKRYHHILNPSTGRPAAGVRSVTVVAPTAEAADAYATAAFVAGPDKGIEMLDALEGVDGMILAEDLDRFHSEDYDRYAAGSR